jgi:hypothetical protein
MKHRHPSQDGEGGFNPDAGFDPRTGEQLSASGGGKVYRGVPFYERNKNPKIAQGYKEGYKYRHRKQKPLTAAELKKIEEKRNREQQKLERKQRKEAPEDTGTEETPAEEAPAGENKTEAVQADEAGATETKSDSKAEKRQRRRERRNKEKPAEAQPPAEPAEQSPPKPKPAPKPAEDEKKDGF